jgi:hypothetical protein
MMKCAGDIFITISFFPPMSDDKDSFISFSRRNSKASSSSLDSGIGTLTRSSTGNESIPSGAHSAACRSDVTKLVEAFIILAKSSMNHSPFEAESSGAVMDKLDKIIDIRNRNGLSKLRSTEH